MLHTGVAFLHITIKVITTRSLGFGNPSLNSKFSTKGLLDDLIPLFLRR